MILSNIFLDALKKDHLTQKKMFFKIANFWTSIFAKKSQACIFFAIYDLHKECFSECRDTSLKNKENIETTLQNIDLNISTRAKYIFTSINTLKLSGNEKKNAQNLSTFFCHAKKKIFFN